MNHDSTNIPVMKRKMIRQVKAGERGNIGTLQAVIYCIIRLWTLDRKINICVLMDVFLKWIEESADLHGFALEHNCNLLHLCGHTYYIIV